MHKSFKELSLGLTEEEYRNDGCIHYSMLSDYAKRGFDCIDKLKEKKESPSLLFGSAVDTLITGGQKEYDTKYFVADLPNLTDSLLPIANYLFETYHDTYSSLDEIDDNILAEVGKENNFYANDKYRNYRIKLIKEGCSKYYDMKHVAGEKQIVTCEFNQSVIDTVNALKTSEATHFYFEEDNPFDGIERCYQLQFRSTFDNVPYSCMADLIIVDHPNKRIHPIDLKTSSHKEYNFFKSFIEWNYHIQARLYYKIISDNVSKDDFFCDYQIMPYKFIVVNKDTLSPLVWEYADTAEEGTLTYGKYGNIECESPLKLGKELWEYLTKEYKVPFDIDTKQTNELTLWLRGM